VEKPTRADPVRAGLAFPPLAAAVPPRSVAWFALRPRRPEQPLPRGRGRNQHAFTAFTGRSPKYLDPTSSYSTDETPYTYQIYEPLFGYHYLKRPYELIPRAAVSIPKPVYIDAEGRALPEDAPGATIAESVYDIPITRGVMFQPHPAFAKEAGGSFVYQRMSATM